MPEPRLIDVLHLSRPHVIGCWQIGDTLVDPGPESCLETLLAGVSGDIRRVLLTHIHLDHGGATGALVERFPDIEVYVHERGAAHLVDPSRLLQSAERLYGERMQELWGRVAPVPERNIHPLNGGETLDGRVDVMEAPGHASHHVCYRWEGWAFVGDVAGVRIGDSGLVLMPTPPPDIDVEAWLASLDRLEGWGPQRIALTHFGAITGDVARHLDIARARLREWAGLAREVDEETFVERVRAQVREGAGDEADAYVQAAPPEQLYMGLARYWQTRQDGAAAP